MNSVRLLTNIEYPGRSPRIAVWVDTTHELGGSQRNFISWNVSIWSTSCHFVFRIRFPQNSNWDEVLGIVPSEIRRTEHTYCLWSYRFLILFSKQTFTITFLTLSLSFGTSTTTFIWHDFFNHLPSNADAGISSFCAKLPSSVRRQSARWKHTRFLWCVHKSLQHGLHKGKEWVIQ